MQRVYPVCHETVYPYIGRRVCAVTRDGRQFIGKVKGVERGRLILEDCTFDKKSVSLSSVRSEKRPKPSHAADKAKLSGYGGGYRGYGGRGYRGYGGGYGGYGGFGYGGGCFFCPLAFIASLFILPFFFI